MTNRQVHKCTANWQKHNFIFFFFKFLTLQTLFLTATVRRLGELALIQWQNMCYLMDCNGAYISQGLYKAQRVTHQE